MIELVGVLAAAAGLHPAGRYLVTRGRNAAWRDTAEALGLHHHFSPPKSHVMRGVIDGVEVFAESTIGSTE